MLRIRPIYDKLAIGIDVGGTATRVALVGGDGQILVHHRSETLRAHSVGAFVDWVTSLVEETGQALGKDFPEGVAIGLAVAGTLDESRTIVVRSLNLPILEGHPVGQLLAKRSRHRVTLMTDAQAATWGEYFRCDEDPARFAHLRLGTGVACGVVTEGCLQALDVNRATHWDLLIVEDDVDALDCPCGLRGCLGTIASGPALAHLWDPSTDRSDVRTLAEAIEEGDLSALDVVRRASRGVARAIANLYERYRVEVVVMGGGVVIGIPTFTHLTIEQLATQSPEESGTVQVRPALLGDNAGVIGAALRA